MGVNETEKFNLLCKEQSIFESNRIIEVKSYEKVIADGAIDLEVHTEVEGELAGIGITLSRKAA